jgi:cupin fold WbuC family metalloprotein
MQHIYSKVEPGRLLHIVNRREEIEGRTEVIPADQFLQLATLQLDHGTTFRPHQHIWKEGQDKVIAQESWVIIRGMVRVDFYDTDGSLLDLAVLNYGDCSVTLGGGHNYTILTHDALVYEYKTGPYTGQENDKVFL